nr:hypothetical protein [Oceanococcus sp. HetDA_MAG_MS8]
MPVVLVVLLVLTGCAANYKEIPDSVDVRELAPGNGAIYGSMVSIRGGRSYSANAIRLRKKDEKDEVRIVSVKPSDFDGAWPNVYSDPVVDGVPFYFELEAGEWEFFTYGFGTLVGGGYKSWSPRREFSVPFSVTPGQLTYVGEISVCGMTGKNIFGLPIPIGAFVSFNDQYERDSDYAVSTFAGLEKNGMLRGVPQAGSRTEGVVGFEARSCPPRFDGEAQRDLAPN